MSVTQQQQVLRRLCEVISEAQSRDPFAKVTVIVPSAFARVRLRRDVGQRQGICNVHFKSWIELTTELARSSSGAPLRVPSAIITREALRQTLRSSSLPALTQVARSAAAVNDMAAAVTELWHRSDQQRADVVTAGVTASTIVTVCDELSSYLEERGFTHLGKVLELAASSLGGPELGTLVLWFSEPAGGRDDFVLERLRATCMRVVTISRPSSTPKLSELTVVRDPQEEIRATLRTVLKAAREGVPLWQQAIVHPGSERYRRILHQELARAGVPSVGTVGPSLAQSSTGRFLLGALELAATDLPRDKVMSWLASATIQVGQESLPAPLTRWGDISARAGVVKGIDQWMTRLERFAVGGRDRDPHVAHSSDETAAARSLADFVTNLSTDLEVPGGPWSSWVRWALHVLDKYLDPNRGGDRWPAIELAARDQVDDALARVRALDALGSDTDLETFTYVVRSELTAERIHDPEVEVEVEVEVDLDEGAPSPRASGPLKSGIFVGSPRDANGLLFTQVHLVGLADQMLPGAARAPRLPDELVRADQDDLMTEDVSDLLALSGKVSGTRPLIDPRSGESLVPSRWLEAGAFLGPPVVQRSIASFAESLDADGVHTPLDPAEHVLASLKKWSAKGLPLAQHPAAGGRLARAIDSATTKQEADFTRFDGKLEARQAAHPLVAMSPTRLEMYAACPRRYLLAHELKLSPPLRPEQIEELEPRQRGLLVHEILATYVAERVSGSERSLARLFEIGDQQIAQAIEEGRCGPPLVAEVEKARLMSELRRFFDEDVLQPVAAELSFGGLADGAPSLSEGPRAGPVILELNDGREVHLRGFVDRVDRADDGSLVVSDYKTGVQSQLAALRKDPVDGGQKLQLPIYGLAATNFDPSARDVHTRYWLVSTERSKPSFGFKLTERVLRRLRDAVSLIIEGIESGAFPGVPGKESYREGRPTFEQCANCDFDRICPTDRSRRWALVSDSPGLDAIRTLRSAPPDDLMDIVASRQLDEYGDGTT
ncbi:MAG: PD-(D/E)XK nuclease family protein [Acidimicrobiales bacterium]